MEGVFYKGKNKMAKIGNEKIETIHILSWHANLPYI